MWACRVDVAESHGEMTHESRWRVYSIMQAARLFAGSEDTPQGPFGQQDLYGAKDPLARAVHGFAARHPVLAGGLVDATAQAQWLSLCRRLFSECVASKLGPRGVREQRGEAADVFSTATVRCMVRICECALASLNLTHFFRCGRSLGRGPVTKGRTFARYRWEWLRISQLYRRTNDRFGSTAHANSP